MGEGDDDHFAELLSEIDVLKQAMNDMKDQVQFVSRVTEIRVKLSRPLRVAD